jgi:hypothetical protein
MNFGKLRKIRIEASRVRGLTDLGLSHEKRSERWSDFAKSRKRHVWAFKSENQGSEVNSRNEAICTTMILETENVWFSSKSFTFFPVYLN